MSAVELTIEARRLERVALRVAYRCPDATAYVNRLRQAGRRLRNRAALLTGYDELALVVPGSARDAA